MTNPKKNYTFATQAIPVDYYISYDVMPGDSFVGYGGVIWAG